MLDSGWPMIIQYSSSVNDYYLLTLCLCRPEKYKPEIFPTAQAVRNTKVLYFQVRHENPVSR